MNKTMTRSFQALAVLAMLAAPAGAVYARGEGNGAPFGLDLALTTQQIHLSRGEYSTAESSGATATVVANPAPEIGYEGTPALERGLPSTPEIGGVLAA